MTYNTGNAVPSTDPRDLDDNAQALDRFLMSTAASEPDRLGELRKTWHQMEIDAAALVSPNVSALAALTAAADKGVFFSATGPVAMGTYTLTSFVRGLGASIDQAAFRTAIGALNVNDTGAYAGSAAKLTAARSIACTGDATWSVSFDGSTNATAALALANSGVTAATYDRVTVDAKGRVTAGTNKPAWTTYTPTVTANSGTFTSASATGKYLIADGICHLQVVVTVTTKGAGANPIFTLPVPAPALSGNLNMPLLASEQVVNGKSGRAIILADLLRGYVRAADATDLASADGAVIYINGSYPIA